MAARRLSDGVVLGVRVRGSGSGSCSIARDDLGLLATGLPAATLGLFFHGESERLPGNMPLGSGNLCVGGATRRMAVVTTDPTGRASLSPTLAGPDSLGAVPDAGDVLRIQLWFRDGVGTSNTTAGLRVVVTR